MKIVSKAVSALYVLFLLWLVLFKFTLHISERFDAHVRGINVIPFTGLLQANSLQQIGYNLLFFVPFGLLLGVTWKRGTFWRKLAYIFYFSLAVEITQYVFAIGITDITDVIMNTSGGLLGLALYGLAHEHVGTKKLDRWITVLIGTVIVSLLTVVLNFQLSHRTHRVAHLDTPVASQLTVDKDVQLAWPATGEAAVTDVESGQLVRSSDNETPLPTASMAKVIAALAILEKQPLAVGQTGPSYTLTSADVADYRSYLAKGGSVLPVHEGMVLTQYQALQAMLLPSANNVADMLAERTFGSIEAYTSYAQAMLQRMGLHQTVIADASGFNSATVSPPSELVTIGIAALKNPVIAEIVAQPQAQIAGVGTITNTNKLLGTDGVIGIKTGSTGQAVNCLLFAADYADKNGGKATIVGVIMGGTDKASLFHDSIRLLESAKRGFELTDMQSTDAVVTP